MILLIDNYDSFAHNLARYLRQLRQDVRVIRNDELSLKQINDLRPQAIILSPGPCTPDEAGICLSLVERFAESIPMLGVCLGHQVICQAFGSSIVRVPPVHGRSTRLTHFGDPLFAKIDFSFVAGRYHSLIVDRNTLPAGLPVIAESSENIVMAVALRDHPVYGVQFHPESILTECGYRLLGNFLGIAKIAVEQGLIDQLASELEAQSQPVTKEMSKQPDPSNKSNPASVTPSITPHPW